MGHCVPRLGVLLWLVVPRIASAQLPPVGVPGGVLRVELDGALETFDTRWRDGAREGYAADFNSPALGADRIPALAEVDAQLLAITGTPGSALNLGGFAADAAADVSTGTVGLSLGLTRAITLFGRIPLVRSRVQTTFALDPTTANAGATPVADAQGSFFEQFDAALAALGSKIVAGDYNGDPTLLALAQTTFAGGTDLRNRLFQLLADPTTASPFVPIASSPAGAAVAARITALQGTLAGSLGVAGFSLGPTLPDVALTRDELLQFLGPGGPIGLRLGGSPVTFRGDAEAGAALTLADRWDRGSRPGGFRAAVEGLVRFPTGRRERSDRPLDLGTGSGQTDVELRLTTDFGGGSWGARLEGTYVRQLASDIGTRVTAPGQPLVGPQRLANVRLDPGDLVAVGALPFYRLARTFAIQGAARYWRRGSDAVSYSSPADAIPGVDAAVLAGDSKATALTLGAGITYANLGGLRPGGTGLPVEASWTYERVARATGGRVPDANSTRIRFRLYTRLLGK